MDSDVLFFSSPNDLINGMEGSHDSGSANNLYSVDVDHVYTYRLDPTKIENLLGRPIISRLNAGLIRIRQNAINLWRVERYLRQLDFWSDTGEPKHLTEQTVRAMELTLEGALPLPSTYAICPNPEKTPGLVSGHYCGGGYWASLYYTLGLPYLAKIFLAQKIEGQSVM